MTEKILEPYYNTVVIISGYFDPLHEGHIEYINYASKLGFMLCCIVNNDKQAELKKGKSYINENARYKIMSSLKQINFSIISIDEDKSVSKSIEFVYNTFKSCYPNTNTNFIFAKGGDRFSSEIPEAEVCRELGIKIIDGLGKKINSSSEIIKRINDSNK
jgi:cytidyltransferase-like protein